MAIESAYAPGVCNIGSVEIRRRMIAGWAGLAILAVGWAALIIGDAAAPWYLLLFFPAIAMSSGFVQAGSRFCYYFGFSGLFNFGAIGRRARIADHEANRRDSTKAMRVLSVSLLIAAGVTFLAYTSALGFG